MERLIRAEESQAQSLRAIQVAVEKSQHLR
jgi:hypothetical protein